MSADSARQAELSRAWQQSLPKCWTTITMPTAITNLNGEVVVDINDLTVPFPVVRFIQAFEYSLDEMLLAWKRQQTTTSKSIVRMKAKPLTGLRGVEEVIIYSYDGVVANWPDANDDVEVTRKSIFSIERTTWFNDDGSCFVRYGPSAAGGVTPITETPAMIYLSCFNTWTNSRSARFVERPISRQVRRASGFSLEYREFVVMRKGEGRKSDWTGALSMRKLIPTLRAMHPVRSHLRQEHLRTLRNGEIMVVPQTRVVAHVRGKVGTATQVKDYLLK